jgi:hypothetical protein
MKRLPAPTDAPGLAFHDGRAAIDDINEFLGRVIKKKEA